MLRESKGDTGNKGCSEWGIVNQEKLPGRAELEESLYKTNSSWRFLNVELCLALYRCI